MEGLVLLRIDLCTHHVGRQQVGSKLNAAEVSADKLREGLDGQGLCQTRYAFEQDVAIAQKTY